MKSKCFLMVAGLMLVLFSYSSAQVPQMINYQGKLTDSLGAPVNDTIQMVFSIYAEEAGINLLWADTQTTVIIDKGVFNVLLGSGNLIPYSVFDGNIRFLGVKVGSDPEITPRRPMVSVPYAYRAGAGGGSINCHDCDTIFVNEGQANSITAGMITDNQIGDADISTLANITPSKISGTAWTSTNDGSISGLDADLLDGQHASAFLSPTNDYGRSGVATDLYEGTSTLTSKYVNEGQVNSVSSGMIADNAIVRTDVALDFKAPYTDTADYARAFSGTVENADKVDLLHASPNPTPGYLYPLDNSAKMPNARLYTGSGNGLDADLLDGQHTSAFALSGHNHDAVYINDGSGEINATSDFNFPSPTFITNLDADKLDGQDALAFLSTANDYGRSGVAMDLYEGTNTLTSKYVNEGQANSITSGMITDNQIVDADIYAFANITPSKISGTAWTSNNDGSGSGLDADLLDGLHSTSFLSTSNDYGRQGVATDLYEGSQTLSSKYSLSSHNHFGQTWSGTGPTLYSGLLVQNNFSDTDTRSGLKGVCYGSGVLPAHAVGVFGEGHNTGSGEAMGGWFHAGPDGTGLRVGVKGSTDGNSSYEHTGVYGYGNNTSNGKAYGGYFETYSGGTGEHYGLYARGNGSSSTEIRGVYGFAENTSSGIVVGGRFDASVYGTGEHLGVVSYGYGASTQPTTGYFGYAQNTSSGQVHGGYFEVSSSGTGTHYGVWAYESAGGKGAAVYAAGDFAGSGAKYAVAKTSQGRRLLSVIESPEVWFEDFGEGQLVNGKSHIELDPLFTETITINTEHPMKVFVQLTSGNPINVVVNKGTSGFDVVASDQTSSASFDYRVVAKRKGYENERLKQTDVGKDDPNLYPELLSEKEKKYQDEEVKIETERKFREEKQKKMEEESMRMEKERETR